MSDSTVNLATLIGSRICHDLISPVGAITNGLELLEMSGSMEGPELELISDSVQNAGARIRFFRIAYGIASDQMLGRQEVASVLQDIAAGGRLRFDWRPEGPNPRAMVRLAFLALQCCETAMPYGGEVTISCTDERWTICGVTSKLNLEPTLWRGLMNGTGPDEVTPAQVQFALFPSAARELGRDIQLDHDETSVTITF
ncbi:MAG: histidine phosphotransferase family protein [Arenibacterium sp.]